MIPWTIAQQAPLSRQEHWRRLPFPFPGDLPNKGIELMSPVPSPLTGVFFITEPPGKPKGGKRRVKGEDENKREACF